MWQVFEADIVHRFSQDIQLIDAELPISLLNVAASEYPRFLACPMRARKLTHASI